MTTTPEYDKGFVAGMTHAANLLNNRVSVLIASGHFTLDDDYVEGTYRAASVVWKHRNRGTAGLEDVTLDPEITAKIEALESGDAEK